MFSKTFILLISIFLIFLPGDKSVYGKNPHPVFCVGGGYLDGGCNHSGGILQAEYKFGKYLWYRLRPQITLLVPEFCSFFIGAGIGWEYNLTERITLTPSFTPGFYYKGGKGRNLGFPLEFRSAIELAYSLNNKSTIGIQAYHISNAHLSNKNPGINAYVLFVSFPMTSLQY
jgi:lipid A 3-O-deacylase